MWFWNNQSDDTKPMFGRWLGVSHSVGSALRYWIISEKGKVLSLTTFQHLNDEEPRDPDVQYWIRDYHDFLEDLLGSKDFDTTNSLMIMNRLFLRVNLTRRDIKDLQIPLR